MLTKPPMVATELWIAGIDETAAVATLHDLNAEFMRAFAEGDAAWYWAHLSDDFVCTLSDGRRVNRPDFLDLRADGACADRLTYDEVDVRLLGDAALVQGVMHCMTDDECESIRYTQVWRRRWGVWHAAAAQLTPIELDSELTRARRGGRLGIRRQA
jgi:ketosteroid isomerase-like protein